MKKPKVKDIYEPEDNVLNIWLSDKPYDYAEDNNYVITHYSKDDEPVYIEVLFASKLLKDKGKVKTKNISKEVIKENSPVAIPHRIKLKLT